MDIVSKAKRSEMMAHVRGCGNKDTELVMVRLFRNWGITGWRRRQHVFGNPDFVFRRVKVAVFVDGCFWHGCPAHGRVPKTHRRFWAAKFAANKARDRVVNRMLRADGWTVIRVWEHELRRKNQARLQRRLARLM